MKICFLSILLFFKKIELFMISIIIFCFTDLPKLPKKATTKMTTTTTRSILRLDPTTIPLLMLEDLLLLGMYILYNY